MIRIGSITVKPDDAKARIAFQYIVEQGETKLAQFIPDVANHRIVDGVARVVSVRYGRTA